MFLSYFRSEIQNKTNFILYFDRLFVTLSIALSYFHSEIQN